MARRSAIILASMVLFGLPMNGSWLLLILSLSLYLAGALGLGLMISTVADSQQAAFQMAMLASFLPTMMLSGFVFPIASMPAAIRAVTYVVPARYFLVALRAIVLKGAGSVGPLLAATGGAALASYAERHADWRDGVPSDGCSGAVAATEDETHLYMMWKEVIELRQDPRIFGIIFIAPVLQLAILGYAATTDVRNVPVVVVDADEAPHSQALISRFTGSGIFSWSTSCPMNGRSIAISRRLTHGWRSRIPARLRRERRRGPARNASGCGGRVGREFDQHRAGIREQPDDRYAQEMAEQRRAPGPATATTARQYRAARARLVQSDARKPLLHAAGHLRAAAARRDVESLVDGHRARARNRHARAAERHAAGPAAS